MADKQPKDTRPRPPGGPIQQRQKFKKLHPLSFMFILEIYFYLEISDIVCEYLGAYPYPSHKEFLKKLFMQTGLGRVGFKKIHSSILLTIQDLYREVR